MDLHTWGQGGARHHEGASHMPAAHASVVASGLMSPVAGD